MCTTLHVPAPQSGAQPLDTNVPARDPATKPYRIAMYAAYGLVAALLFLQIVRSVVSDLYGRTQPAEPAQAQTPMACLEDVDRLYAQLSARAVQPAPGGLEGGALSREWDAWTRRWEDEVARVRDRCNLDGASEPARRHLARAISGLEQLRRELSRSGEDAAHEARAVKDALASARSELRLN
jgi:hypothetical protein